MDDDVVSMGSGLATGIVKVVEGFEDGYVKVPVVPALLPSELLEVSARRTRNMSSKVYYWRIRC